ncbi:MAG: hypothetical protein ACI841_003240 [Planctomycetota bacterium]|jgi:hypothetical protein
MLMDEPQNQDVQRNRWILAASFAGGAFLSVVLLQMSHARTVQRFEARFGPDADVQHRIRELRAESSGMRASALLGLEPFHFEHRELCEAVLDLASDSRVPDIAVLDQTASVAELARQRLLELAPDSPAWHQAVQMRLKLEPSMRAWLSDFTSTL